MKKTTADHIAEILAAVDDLEAAGMSTPTITTAADKLAAILDRLDIDGNPRTAADAIAADLLAMTIAGALHRLQREEAATC